MFEVMDPVTGSISGIGLADATEPGSMGKADSKAVKNNQLVAGKRVEM